MTTDDFQEAVRQGRVSQGPDGGLIVDPATSDDATTGFPQKGVPLIHEATRRFLGANEDSAVVVLVAGRRTPVAGVFYDDRSDQVVIDLAEPGHGRYPDLAANLAAISRWVDEHPPNAQRDPEARLWGRCAKVTEEAGEVVQALIAMTGQNPRKGQHGCAADVLDELLDVAATALAAVEHINGNRGGSVSMLAEHVSGLVDRAGLGEGGTSR